MTEELIDEISGLEEEIIRLEDLVQDRDTQIRDLNAALVEAGRTISRLKGLRCLDEGKKG